MIMARAKDKLEAKEESSVFQDFVKEALSLEGWSEIAR